MIDSREIEVSKKNIAKTTGMGHNCGFYTIVHYLAYQDHLTKNSDDEGVKTLISTYNNVYGKTDTPGEIKAAQLQADLKKRNPVANEKIMGTVFRYFLKEILINPSAIKDNFYEQSLELFNTAITLAINGEGIPAEMLNIVESHKTLFPQPYDNEEEVARKKSILKTLQGNKAKRTRYWQSDKGYLQYVGHISSITVAAALTPQELHPLLESLNIPYTIYNKSEADDTSKVKLTNLISSGLNGENKLKIVFSHGGGGHYEFYMDDEKLVAQHNRAYSNRSSQTHNIKPSKNENALIEIKQARDGKRLETISTSYMQLDKVFMEANKKAEHLLALTEKMTEKTNKLDKETAKDAKTGIKDFFEKQYDELSAAVRGEADSSIKNVAKEINDKAKEEGVKLDNSFDSIRCG